MPSKRTMPCERSSFLIETGDAVDVPLRAAEEVIAEEMMYAPVPMSIIDTPNVSVLANDRGNT